MIGPVPGSAQLRPRRERGVIDVAGVPYGHSREGRPLVCHGAGELLVVAGVHGDEPETTVVVSAALRSLVPGALRCAVVLAANPDGLVRGTRGNAEGVDLNRNLPTTDWRAGETLHLWELDGPPEVALGTGARPSSEPETRALLDLVERLRPRAVVAVHAPLACVDDAQATSLGRWLARRSGLPLVREIGYPVPGSLGTWGAEHGVRVVTYELPPDGVPALVHGHGPVVAELLAGGASLTSSRPGLP
jgi:protein MpaA